MAQDVLATVTNSKGGRTSVTYTPSTQLGGNNELPYDVLVVTAIGTYDNLGNAATIDLHLFRRQAVLQPRHA